MRYLLQLLATLSSALLVPGCVSEGNVLAETRSFRLLPQWPEGRVEAPTVLVLKDKDTYARMFRETYAQFVLPTPEPPEVDFAREQVVAVLWGAKPSTGYRVSVVSVTSAKNETTITVKTSTPKGGAGDAITYPSVVLATPPIDNIRVIVTGDRIVAHNWSKDFSKSKGEGWELIVE